MERMDGIWNKGVPNVAFNCHYIKRNKKLDVYEEFLGHMDKKAKPGNGFPYTPTGDGQLKIRACQGDGKVKRITVEGEFKESNQQGKGAECIGLALMKTNKFVSMGNIKDGKPNGPCTVFIKGTKGKKELDCFINGGQIQKLYGIKFTKDGAFLRDIYDHTLDSKPRSTIVSTGDILIEDPIIYNDGTDWIVTFKQGTSACAFGKSDNRDDHFLSKIPYTPPNRLSK